jgi:hypothetical protein
MHEVKLVAAALGSSYLVEPDSVSAFWRSALNALTVLLSACTLGSYRTYDCIAACSGLPGRTVAY